MSTLAKLVAAADTDSKQVQASREKFDGSNANLANKTNVYAAYAASDQGKPIDLGAGADRFHFGGYTRENDGKVELTIDMGSETDVVYDEGVHVPKWMNKDKDLVNLSKSIDEYDFSLFPVDAEEGEATGITIKDTATGQVINFIDVEVIRVNGIKIHGNSAEELLAAIESKIEEIEDGYDLSNDKNHMNLKEAYAAIDGSEAGADYYNTDKDKIQLGADKDKFYFGTFDAGEDVRNFTVEMGKIDREDTVILHGSINDYAIELKEQDGNKLNSDHESDYAKFTYTNPETGATQTISFRSAEKFVFQNNVYEDGAWVNKTNDSFTYDQLVEAMSIVAEAEEVAVLDNVLTAASGSDDAATVTGGTYGVTEEQAEILASVDITANPNSISQADDPETIVKLDFDAFV